MKRSLFAAVMMFLFVTAGTAAAQTTTAKKPAVKHPPSAPSRVVEDKPDPREYFAWKHYGANPLVRDEDIPALPGVEVDTIDKAQIHNMVFNSVGYENGNRALREGLAGSAFSSPTTPLPDKFWSEVVRQFQEGKVEPRCIQDGERAGDIPLSFGSKVDASGRRIKYVEGPYPVNQTGGQICGWMLTEQIAIESGPNAGKWVKPIIYKRCRNTSGFFADAPPAPTPVVVEEQKPTIAEAAAAAPMPVVIPAAAPLVETHGSICGKIAWRCWVPAAAAAGVLCAVYCGGDDHHAQGGQSLPPPIDQPGKTPQPPAPRPIIAPAAVVKPGLNFSIRF